MSRKKMRVLIVDDEQRARRLVRTRLENIPDCAIVGEAADGDAASRLIRELTPDIVILDIHMPGQSGLEVIAKLPRNKLPVVIFLTAYDEYAVRAFELYALDYLLKPFTRERFESAIARARERLQTKQTGASTQLYREFISFLSRMTPGPGDNDTVSQKSDYLQRIMVNSSNIPRLLDVSDIMFLEAEDHFVRLYTIDSSYLVSHQISELEKNLDPSRFVRIHRSIIVNISAVEKSLSAPYGTMLLVLKDGRKLKISRTYVSRGKLALLAQTIKTR
jgi:two-component system LytT family response regulator